MLQFLLLLVSRQRRTDQRHGHYIVMDIKAPRPTGKRVRQPPAFHIVFVTDTTASATSHTATRPLTAPENIKVPHKDAGKRKRPSAATALHPETLKEPTLEPPPQSLSSLPPVTPYSFLPDNKDVISNTRSNQDRQQQHQQYQHHQLQDSSAKWTLSLATPEVRAAAPVLPSEIRDTELKNAAPRQTIDQVESIDQQQYQKQQEEQMATTLQVTSPPPPLFAPPSPPITDSSSTQQNRKQGETVNSSSNIKSSRDGGKHEDRDRQWWEFD